MSFLLLWVSSINLCLPFFAVFWLVCRSADELGTNSNFKSDGWEMWVRRKRSIRGFAWDSPHTDLCWCMQRSLAVAFPWGESLLIKFFVRLTLRMSNNAAPYARYWFPVGHFWLRLFVQGVGLILVPRTACGKTSTPRLISSPRTREPQNPSSKRLVLWLTTPEKTATKVTPTHPVGPPSHPPWKIWPGKAPFPPAPLITTFSPDFPILLQKNEENQHKHSKWKS